MSVPQTGAAVSCLFHMLTHSYTGDKYFKNDTTDIVDIVSVCFVFLNYYEYLLL